MRLGIDFGSTYSTITKYDYETDRVEALKPSEGESESIPSVVCMSKKNNNTILCGSTALAVEGEGGDFALVFLGFGGIDILKCSGM